MIQSGTRVLFLGPRTFGYEREIQRELERAGCAVDWFDDRPASTPLAKALIRFRPELIGAISDAYFDRIIAAKKALRYDVVFIIKGEAISAKRLLALRESQPSARFLYYTWDSLKNVKNSASKLVYFEKAYSFDRFDSLSNGAVRHLPLFYLDEYAKLGAAPTCASEVDLLFLGSIHSDRHAVVRRIVRAARLVAPDVSLHTHFYYQSKWVFALRKAVDPFFRSIPWSDVRWRSLDKDATLELIGRSKILLDVHHPGQTGLTMRTIECLGARKKMITTNPDVLHYDFYRPENILLVDRRDAVVPAAFLAAPYSELPESLYRRYSLRSWLDEIFS